MRKLIFVVGLLILTGCCSKQQTISNPEKITCSADTIQGWLYDTSTYEMVKIKHDDFSSKDTVVHTDTIISVIRIPIIK